MEKEKVKPAGYYDADVVHVQVDNSIREAVKSHNAKINLLQGEILSMQGRHFEQLESLTLEIVALKEERNLLRAENIAMRLEIDHRKSHAEG